MHSKWAKSLTDEEMILYAVRHHYHVPVPCIQRLLMHCYAIRHWNVRTIMPFTYSPRFANLLFYCNRICVDLCTFFFLHFLFILNFNSVPYVLIFCICANACSWQTLLFVCVFDCLSCVNNSVAIVPQQYSENIKYTSNLRIFLRWFVVSPSAKQQKHDYCHRDCEQHKDCRLSTCNNFVIWITPANGV